MKYHTTSIIPVLKDFADFFSISLVFNMSFTLMLVEVNMKVKIEISICTGLMLNDHSNPYIESTTILSDMYVCTIYTMHVPWSK